MSKNANSQIHETPPKVAIYVRLSKEDRNKVNKEDDSESIMNQQTMLLDYCKQNGWEVYDIYNDEDFSGSDRERPDFNRLIDDARNKRFNTIICKTQSRFARDMEIIEKYINGLFLIWGIRFISIIDNNDSTNQTNRKSRQINSLIDQWYLEDLSDNVKATLASKRKQGLWVGAFAPYGYQKDPDNKNHLVVDEEAAEVVKYVFHLYLQGFGVTSIARKLNEEKITNPATYKQQHGQPFQNINGKCSDCWHTYSIQRMLSNQIYIGNTVQGLQENISYKSNKKRQKPKEEWDIVEHTHEPIIERELFDKVQHLRQSKPKCNHTGKPNPFAGKVRCLKCGGSMRLCYTHHQRYFRCNTTYFAKDQCEGTFVSETVLQRETVKQIRKLYHTYIDNEFAANRICVMNGITKKQDAIRQKINQIDKKISIIDLRIKEVYIDKLDGVIATQDFLNFKRDFSIERATLIAAKRKLEEEVQELNDRLSDSENRFEIIERLKNIRELDYITVSTLIDHLEVGGNRNNRIINIHWNI